MNLETEQNIFTQREAHASLALLNDDCDEGGNKANEDPATDNDSPEVTGPDDLTLQNQEDTKNHIRDDIQETNNDPGTQITRAGILHDAHISLFSLSLSMFMFV